MSRSPPEPAPIPEETTRGARAACPKGTLAMRLRDALGGISPDEAFAHRFSSRGPPAEAPWRLALVSLLHEVEGMTDRHAAEAVRSRMNGKDALSLPLEDPGCAASVRAECRARVSEGQAEQVLWDTLREHGKQRGWLTQGGKQRTDSTPVLASVRSLSPWETVGEPWRAAWEDLAEADPDGLVTPISPPWLPRDGPRVDTDRLPKAEAERKALAEPVGRGVAPAASAARSGNARGVARSAPCLSAGAGLAAGRRPFGRQAPVAGGTGSAGKRRGDPLAFRPGRAHQHEAQPDRVRVQRAGDGNR